MEEWATTTAEWMNREIKRENKKTKKFKRRDLNVKHLFNIRNCLLLVGRFIGWLHWRRTTKDGNVAFSRTMVVHFERWLCILRRAVEVAVDAAPQKNLYFGRRRWAFSNFFFCSFILLPKHSQVGMIVFSCSMHTPLAQIAYFLSREWVAVPYYRVGCRGPSYAKRIAHFA